MKRLIDLGEHGTWQVREPVTNTPPGRGGVRAIDPEASQGETPSPNPLDLERVGVRLGSEDKDRAGVTSKSGVEPLFAASTTRVVEVKPGPVAFLIDVAGMDESNTSLATSLQDEGLGNPGRDSTTLTIVAIDLSTLATLNHPTYRVLARHSWTGQNHLTVFGQIKNLAEKFSPQHIVIDATGVGEGLWALLDGSFPTRVIPVKFTAQEKSEIGWKFLSIIETGRFIDPDPSDEVRLQYSYCISEVLPGPMKTLRWGVPDGTRGPDGLLIHDDFVLADSLTAVIDGIKWHAQTDIFASEGFDPFDSPDTPNSFFL